MKARTWRFSGRGYLFASMFALLLSGAHATCIDFSSPIDAPRHPNVQQEYAEAKYVVLGKVRHARLISQEDDPDGYDWTIYDVEVLASYKGATPKHIQLASENTTSRFPMDDGVTYLLFVSHSDMRETAGGEELPHEYVDNCGNSGTMSESASAITTIRRLAHAR